MRVLVYCNTAMLMPDEKGQVNITDTESLTASLQAESPDEVALILAAAKHCGVLVTKRNGHEVESLGLNLYTDPSVEEQHDSVLSNEKVELLAVNEFDSDRKMMSVLVRIPSSGRIVLYCKGADSSMLKSCDPRANPYTAHCSSHIDKFASTGLRTLVAAYRDVSPAEAESWLATYKVASNSITERLPLLSKCATAIESNMILLGAVGIEDELQDGVPDAIEMLHCAGKSIKCRLCVLLSEGFPFRYQCVDDHRRQGGDCSGHWQEVQPDQHRQAGGAASSQFDWRGAATENPRSAPACDDEEAKGGAREGTRWVIAALSLDFC